MLTGKPFNPVEHHVQSVIAALPTGPDGAAELWKLNHYYERLDEWNEAHRITKNPFAGPAAESLFEMDNLTADPEERHNRVDDASDALSTLKSILDRERDAKRRVRAHRNPAV